MGKTTSALKVEGSADFVLVGTTGRFHNPLPHRVKVCRAADLDEFGPFGIDAGRFHLVSTHLNGCAPSS